MTPGVYNVTAKHRVRFELRFNWQDQTGTTVVLTGYSASLVIGYADGSSAVVMALTTSNGGIVLGGAPDNVVVADINDLMLAMLPGNYVYDLQLSSAIGQKSPLLTGRFVLSANLVTP